MYLRILGYRTFICQLSAIERICGHVGLRVPMCVDNMYCSGEGPAYIEAAIMAVNQVGD